MNGCQNYVIFIKIPLIVYDNDGIENELAVENMADYSKNTLNFGPLIADEIRHLGGV